MHAPIALKQPIQTIWSRLAHLLAGLRRELKRGREEAARDMSAHARSR